MVSDMQPIGSQLSVSEIPNKLKTKRRLLKL